MRFIVDESVSRKVTAYLRVAGHDVLDVAEISPQAEDQDILARAVAEERIVITNDKDFGELIFRKAQVHSGVILLRLKDDSGPNQVQVLESALGEHAGRLPGHFTVVSERGIRHRRYTSGP